MINTELMQKFKIGILGIGGVGGYFGGKLAAYYHNSNEVQIIFIARGENKNVTSHFIGHTKIDLT